MADPGTATYHLSTGDVAEIIGDAFHTTAGRCHAVSLAIVQSGRIPGSRVARGTCRNVPGQHSWVVVGPDCYDPDARIVDPTLWAHAALGGQRVWHGTARQGWHVPHGAAGTIWTYGKPTWTGGTIIHLTPTATLSRTARQFLNILGPLDCAGWGMLANAPIGGNWPAAEIIAAMDDTPELAPLVPIDILGMLTDRNPGNLYLPTRQKAAP